MRIFERIEENLGALVIASMAAGFATMAGFLLTFAVGLIFRDELSYGMPLLFGIPAALVAGGTVFRIVFRKMR